MTPWCSAVAASPETVGATHRLRTYVGGPGPEHAGAQVPQHASGKERGGGVIRVRRVTVSRIRI